MAEVIARKRSCDVLVVGAGAAGIGAAAAAGQAGARVLLLDRYGFLGGLATAGEVGTVCGLFLRDSLASKPEFVSDGFVRDFGETLQKASGMEPLKLEAGLWVLPYETHHFHRVCDRLLSGCGQVELLLHSTVSAVRRERERIVEADALAWNERLSIHCQAVVDTTGEATVCALAGAAIEDGATNQAPALLFTLAQVNLVLVSRAMLGIRRQIRLAIEAGNLAPDCERLAFVPGHDADGRLTLKLNLPAPHPEMSSPENVTAWELSGRRLVEELTRFLTAHTEAFKHARLLRVASQVGIRTGRRIKGRARLEEKDVVGAHKFAQGVARGCWPMESWGQRLQPQMRYLFDREYYDIPAGCLQPEGLENTFAAGRCISATPGAISSARVIGTALATGWAAGQMAARVR